MTTFEVMAQVALLEVAELGLQCSQIVGDFRWSGESGGLLCGSRCDGIATHTVHWPSGDTNCCADHVRRWREIAEAMGMTNLQTTPLPVWRRQSDVDDSAQRFALMELT